MCKHQSIVKNHAMDFFMYRELEYCGFKNTGTMNIKGLLVVSSGLTLSQYEFYLGQTTETTNYSCNENNNSVKFTLSWLNHSAWNPPSNCSRQ